MLETEFDLNRALFLTYVGVGAAFLVLGSLVVFTSLIGWWGRWRLRRNQAREAESVQEVWPVTAPLPTAVETAANESPLAAAIGVAVALALEERRRETAAEESRSPAPSTDSNAGWREQGRMVALESRRIRERDR